MQHKAKGFNPKTELKPFIHRNAEIRTRDLTHPKGARYQAAPRSVAFKYLRKIFFVKLARSSTSVIVEHCEQLMQLCAEASNRLTLPRLKRVAVVGAGALIRHLI